MKNFEKHIDTIAEIVADELFCGKCPCRKECAEDDEDHEDCMSFFKFWALKEADDEEEKEGEE